VFLQQQFQAGVNPLGIFTADFNNDGWIDIAASTGNSLVVLVNNALFEGDLFVVFVN
jgi:hypothetical protein